MNLSHAIVNIASRRDQTKEPKVHGANLLASLGIVYDPDYFHVSKVLLSKTMVFYCRTRAQTHIMDVILLYN